MHFQFPFHPIFLHSSIFAHGSQKTHTTSQLFLVVARSLYLVSLYECMFSCIIFIVINFSYSFSIDGLRATSILLMLCFVIIASIRRGEIQERKSFLIKTKLNKYTINVTSEKERLMRLLSTAYPEYIIESVLKSNIYELPTLACDHATLLVLRVINYHEIMQNCQADEAIIFFGDFFRLISRVVRNCGMTKFRCSNGTYMAIGGITDSSESITVSVVGAAIKIRDSVNATKFVVGNFKVKASIGIHFGKAHTGAVSSAKGSFEVFGDACYVAESALKTGEENAIFVSIPVHERCKKYFEFEPDSVVFDGLEFWKVVHRRHLPLPKVTPKIPVLKRSKKNNLDMMSMIDENYVQASRIGSFIYNVKFHDIRLEDEFQSDFSKRGSENFLRSVAAMTSIFHLLYGIIEVSFFKNHFSFDNGLMVVLVFLRFYIFAPLMVLLACVSYVGDMDWMNVNVMANNATIPYQIHALYGVYTMSKFIYVLVFHLTSLDPIQVNFIVHEVYIWITLQSILPHRLLSRAIFVTVSWIIVVSFSYGYYMYQASFQTLWKTILDIVYLVLIAFSQSLNGYQVAELLLRKQYLLGVQEKETIQKLIAQQELMESILISIIPDHMVTNIRGQDRILERYPDVALILIDIVESRGAVRFLSTRQTFDFFSEVFENIEKMCELYNIVPIKTMGDMYLAMAVKEGEVDDHLARACRMAIETHTHLKNHKFDSWYGTISLRIAVSEGDVIGCVTGRGDLSYEIWGNCVHEAWSILKSTPKDKTRVTDSCAHKLLDSPYIEVETVPMISESGLEEMEKHHYVHVLDSVWGNFIVHTPWMRDDFKGDKLE
eukprot:TRINITY_DN4255_c0_g1_i3.p1 TRINITY_DN4255_c0_g1~~TRINITY_DN4255_c0_g1_i3.p1  ORF type:complete len:831 (+),score=133.86 TRINITY_DN4255_c0_g1_i3:976-3468(+)